MTKKQQTAPVVSEPEKHQWRELLLQVGDNADNILDRLKHNYNRRFRPDQPLQIIPYRGFANDEHAYFTGRVVEYKKPRSIETDSLWNTIVTSYQRFESDEVPDIRVQAEIRDARYETLTDNEGYYQFKVPVTPEMTGDFTFNISLPDDTDRAPGVTAHITCPAPDAAFGVISDIDDTILLTKATSVVQMMRLTLLSSGKSRVAFEGVSAFYRALHNNRNPFFYVSSSPWNLYEFLCDFMECKDIVAGPLLLRDFGIDRHQFIAGPHKTHKIAQITRVLDSYPQLRFILIGDSGQHDPEIYSQCVRDYPGRILAIYIRNVNDQHDHHKQQQRMESLRVDDVPLLLIADTEAAAQHAAQAGYIAKTSIAEITAKKKLDEHLTDQADSG